MKVQTASNPAKVGLFYAGSSVHSLNYTFDERNASRVRCSCGWDSAWHPGDFDATRAAGVFHLEETRKLVGVDR